MKPGPSSDPLAVFQAWYAENEKTGPKHPDAMALATAGADGHPSLRMVLLKSVVGGSFRFFTSYESRKGRELAENPRAALLFHWPALERQVRIEGSVTRTTPEESDDYFATRPRASQLSAYASEQSRATSRQELERLRREAEERFSGVEVPRPERWGGYLLEPDSIELWISDPTRLHERHLYQRAEGGWRYQLLAP